MTRADLLQQLEGEVAALKVLVAGLPREQFFMRSVADKWSVAENMEHLVLAVRPLLLAFSLPGLALRMFGSPKRSSMSYHELVALYRQKLAGGARASRPYVPASRFNQTPQQMLARFEQIYQRFATCVAKWDEQQLDRYSLPHPILGKITLREMVAFTVYHVYHHHQLIKSRL